MTETTSKPTKTILISVDLSELRVAVLEDGRAVEVFIERRGKGSLAGNIYKGRVDNVLPGMEAAFVDIGLEKNGFLYVDEIVLPDVDTKERRKRRIQELLRPGQEVLVQVVKDPMGTKGARVTMELSLAGRFLVLAPDGEGKGVSKRLPDGERERLRKAAAGLDARDVGVIVRTAAEGATSDDLHRDLRFLRKVWAQVEARAKSAPCPSLVHQEADLSLRIIRDLLGKGVDWVLVDSERQYRRINGYVRATQPDSVDKVQHHDEPTPLFERYGVDAAIRSTLNRRVDLPSGGYLIFDFAEAFTVIDVNTGRFVGKSRLEDTITRNNIEAAREVVRQLRLRDIGGIIVIDFIDMSSARNRAEVLKVLQAELEKDRTKTYIVEISPLGLVEMTRQNVTDGVREILTSTCPTCGGEGVVLSEETMAVEAERRLRRLARGTDAEAFLVKVNSKVAARLAGPGGLKLAELERDTGRRFSFQTDEWLPLSEVDVVAAGPRGQIEGDDIPVREGQELRLKIVEPHMYNTVDGIARAGDYPVVVAGGIGYVGQEHRVRIERATATGAFAALLDAAPTRFELPPPSGAGEIELPEPEREVGERLELDPRSGGKRRRRQPAGVAIAAAVATLEGEAASEDAEEGEDEAVEAEAVEENGGEPRRRRRRGGRGRKRPATGEGDGAAPAEEPADDEYVEADAGEEGDEAGDRDEADEDEVPGEEGAAAPRRRRRGRRGGRGRRRPGAADAGNGDAPVAEEEGGPLPPARRAAPEPVPPREADPEPQPAVRFAVEAPEAEEAREREARRKGIIDRLLGR
jgi:ribonuclease G